MSRGRKHQGRPQHLNDRGGRSGSIALAAEQPGRGTWDQRHDRKISHALWCEALKAERMLHRQHVAGFIALRGPRHEVYPCRYGAHWLIESAPRHWHVGRPGRRT